MMGWSALQLELAGVLVLGIAMFVFLGIMSFKRLVAYLKTTHPQLWKSLERPNALAAPDEDRMAIVSFVLWRRYRTVQDPQLSKMGDSLFWSAYVVTMDVILIVAVLGFGVLR